MYVEHTQIRSRLCGAAVHFCFSLVCVRSSRSLAPTDSLPAPRYSYSSSYRTVHNSTFMFCTHIYSAPSSAIAALSDIMLNRLAKHSSCGPGDGVGLSTTCGKRS